jgi:hypothetical protein
MEMASWLPVILLSNILKTSTTTINLILPRAFSISQIKLKKDF